MYFWWRDTFKLLPAYLAVGLIFAFWGVVTDVLRINGIIGNEAGIFLTVIVGFATAHLAWGVLTRPIPVTPVTQAITNNPLPNWGAMGQLAPVTFIYLAFVVGVTPSSSP